MHCIVVVACKASVLQQCLPSQGAFCGTIHSSVFNCCCQWIFSFITLPVQFLPWSCAQHLNSKAVYAKFLPPSPPPPATFLVVPVVQQVQNVCKEQPRKVYEVLYKFCTCWTSLASLLSWPAYLLRGYYFYLSFLPISFSLFLGWIKIVSWLASPCS